MIYFWKMWRVEIVKQLIKYNIFVKKEIYEYRRMWNVLIQVIEAKTIFFLFNWWIAFNKIKTNFPLKINQIDYIRIYWWLSTVPADRNVRYLRENHLKSNKLLVSYFYYFSSITTHKDEMHKLKKTQILKPFKLSWLFW